jgi:predicted nucleotide-binding protein
MAKRTLPPPPSSLDLTPDEMRAGIRRLELRIAEVEAFDPNAFDGDDSSLTQLHASVDEALSRTFGRGTPEYNLYSSAASFDYPLNYLNSTPLPEKQSALAERKRNSLVLLKQAVRSLTEQLEELAAAPAPSSAPEAQPRAPSNRIFIVHGHDDAPKQAVARFLESLGLEVIILHEQANQGRTIIEKFEEHADVGFAVVLLTPDDVGGLKGLVVGKLNPRARQNVVFELGYFIGRLGRRHVCALKLGDVEVPSDISGVIYVLYDPNGAWKQALGQELQEAGYEIDWNRVMRR